MEESLREDMGKIAKTSKEGSEGEGKEETKEA